MKEKWNLRLNNQSQTMGTKRFLYRTFLFFALCANVLFVFRARNNTCSATGQTAKKKLTHWINNNGKVLNSWPKRQVLFKKHYTNSDVYWLQTSIYYSIYFKPWSLFHLSDTVRVMCCMMGFEDEYTHKFNQLYPLEFPTFHWILLLSIHTCFKK